MLKQIALADAIKKAVNGHQVFMAIEIGPATTIDELASADGFLIIEEDPQPERGPKPEPKTKPAQPKQAKKPGIDHGKLIALYRAKWSIEKIADEMGCTTTTVRNHIRQEEQNGAGDGAE